MHLLTCWLARKDRKARQEANDTYLILVERIKEAWEEERRRLSSPDIKSRKPWPEGKQESP
jgi:hypothetical protein